MASRDVPHPETQKLDLCCARPGGAVPRLRGHPADPGSRGRGARGHPDRAVRHRPRRANPGDHRPGRANLVGPARRSGERGHRPGDRPRSRRSNAAGDPAGGSVQTNRDRGRERRAVDRRRAGPAAGGPGRQGKAGGADDRLGGASIQRSLQRHVDRRAGGAPDLRDQRQAPRGCRRRRVRQHMVARSGRSVRLAAHCQRDEERLRAHL